MIAPTPELTSTVRQNLSHEPFVRTAYPPMGRAAAETFLKDDLPLYPKGVIRIAVGGTKISIGYYGDKQGDKTYFRYRVKSPLGGTFRSHNWNAAIRYAKDQAKQLDLKCPSQTEILQDYTALAFQQLKAMAAQADITVLELLQFNIQLCEAAGKNLRATIKDMIKSTFIKDTATPLSELVELGKTMKTILAQHPQLSATQVFASIEQLFPTGKALTPTEILAELAKHKEFRANAKTIKRYEKTIAIITGTTRKPLRQTTSEDIEKIVKSKFVTRSKKGNDVRSASYDSFLSNAKALFNFLILKGQYPAILGNPVAVPLIGRSIQAPKEDHILEPGDLSRWINVSAWQVTPYVVLNADATIRPETIPFLSWDCVDWDSRVIRVPAWASKTYKGVSPRLSEAAYNLLLPFRGCKGPICVYEDTADRARQAAKQAGILSSFHDSGRKSGISFRAAELHGHPGMQEILTLECGNGEEVRRLFYQCYRTPAEAAIYRGYKRVFEPVVVSLAFARQYHRSQIKAQARLIMRKMVFDLKITHISSKQVRASAESEALAEAIALFKDGPSLPSFVTIKDGASCGPVRLPSPKKSKSASLLSDDALANLNKITHTQPIQPDFFQF